ncbi:MAG: ribosome maturation factor RimM [Pseudomonadales bacterium]|nr:ribosome maturation factor RimM [Pseudomonadales bacterium]
MSHSAVTASKRVVLGKLGKAHGIKGWLKLHSYTTPPENILQYSNLHAEINGQRQSLLVDDSRQQKAGLLIHIKGIDDPETAQGITGAEVWVEDSDLPSLEAGEYYWHELEGLSVVNEQGLLFGIVSQLLETGANDVLVVKPTQDSIDERERLIPYLRDSVIKEVDKGAGRITIDWDASYLD